MRRIALTFMFTLAAMPLAAQGYHVAHTYVLGGPGGWDYVIPDVPNHRLFVARENRVMVVSEAGKVLGEVTPIDGAHGTAVVDKVGHGFATSGRDGTIRMFDLKTYKELSTIPAKEDADGIIYDPATDRVFSSDGDANASTVVDPAGKLITNIPLGGKPEYLASAGDGKVYFNLVDKAEVVEVDGRALKVTRRWTTTGCTQPVAMAIDVTHHRLFSGCRSGVLAVSDYRAGKVVATVPIGKGVDSSGYDAALGNIFEACADGTLTVIHQDSPDKYRVVQTLKTPEYSRSMGLDPTNHRVYVVAAKFEEAAQGKRRPPMVPGSFSLLVIER